MRGKLSLRECAKSERLSFWTDVWEMDICATEIFQFNFVSGGGGFFLGTVVSCGSVAWILFMNSLLQPCLQRGRNQANRQRFLLWKMDESFSSGGLSPTCQLRFTLSLSISAAQKR
ncbi:uncharacterized protein LOC112347551 [Selaginella moellendorffii]|uniref:uncharacterized protein LOC112347551 n=1 Tax=Selaginella moellendorffii TaxID=88036 RepID=UPI000D1D03EC|nr:uncharacterized protein LOC112347551 [Selaginella moellendorffii]|eukprot:XP_024534375.1 uncharacterized protein LOC112347551 [Selaginella moellendorffii]